ncbi:hypothetical protein CI610_00891 [invertebrate metagenome]|uniref:Porin domain-containing protein n=1 Tax=invertebrate metagenome TaxID=1711999 RepID=A0A2H9TA37_9ZZZZ
MYTKKILTATIASLIAGQVMAEQVFKSDTTTIDVYGDLRPRFRYDDPTASDGLKKVIPFGQDVTTEEDGDQARQRIIPAYSTTKIKKITAEGSAFGFKVQQQLTDDVYARGQIEFKWDMTDANAQAGDGDLRTNYGYVAAGTAELGELKLGRMQSAQDAMAGKHDFSYELGGASKLGNAWQGTDYVDNAVGYQWSDQGITVMLQAQAETEDYKDIDIGNRRIMDKAKIKNGYGAGINWDSNFGLSLSGSYTRIKIDQNAQEFIRKSDGSNVEITRLPDSSPTIDSASVSASYTIEGLTVAASYSAYNYKWDKEGVKDTYDDNNFESPDGAPTPTPLGKPKIEQQGWGVGVRYAFEEYNVGVYGIYDELKTKYKMKIQQLPDDTELGQEENLKVMTFGLDYGFTDQFMVFAEYAHSKTDNYAGLSSDATAKNKQFTIGTRFYF